MRALYKKIIRNRLAGFGAALVSIICFLSLITPFLGLPDPNVIDTSKRFTMPLVDGYIFGADHLGRDILSRLLWGTRLSIFVGLVAALIAASIGSVIGILAGLYGGKADTLLMRSIDVLMAFPYILLALAIVAVLGPGLMNALIAVAIVNIPFFARNVRGVTLSLVQSDFIAAARLSGRNTFSILLFELLPNLVSVIIVAFSTTIGWMILETAGLSFLGLGSQPPQSDLGSMLGEARAALITHPHTSFIPGLMIFAIVMGINLLGDGIRDALDPRLAKGMLRRSQPITYIDRQKNISLPNTINLLSVNDLQTEFQIDDKKIKAIRNVSFSIEKGQCLAIVGESGSGKSVTALSLTGLVASPPAVISGGVVNFQNIDILSLNYEEIRKIRGKKISYIFQDPNSSLHPLHSIGDQLIEVMLVHESKFKRHILEERAIQLLKDVMIANPERVMNSYPHELSGGMRQRIGIAIALANDPELIIADEPTTALDVTVQAQILDILNRLRIQRGLSLLFISHDMNVIASISDKIAIMYAGQIIETGPTQEVLDQPFHPYTKALLACSPQIGSSVGLPKPIKGMPPLLEELSEGCSFAPRCSYFTKDCNKEPIVLSTIENRSFRCIKKGSLDA